MNKEKLRQEWLAEEKVAHIKGWDFSHINNRYDEEEDLSWNYEEVIRQYLKSEHKLLDVDTGFCVIIMTVANSLVNKRVSELLPNFETDDIFGWCAA